jgi:hypothetical protein
VHSVRVSILARFALRTVVLSVVTVVLMVAYLSSDAAEDPLGLGLLVFAVYVVVALVWGLVDGVRHGAGSSLVVWLLVGLATGCLLPVISAVDAGSADDLGDDLAGTIPFFTLLVLVPAAIGIAVGAVVRAVRD